MVILEADSPECNAKTMGSIVCGRGAKWKRQAIVMKMSEKKECRIC
jgi:hypothetical protein